MVAFVDVALTIVRLVMVEVALFTRIPPVSVESPVMVMVLVPVIAPPKKDVPLV